MAELFVLQEVAEVTAYTNRRTYSMEASLVLNQFAPVQEMLPLLSVIPEVRIQSKLKFCFVIYGTTCFSLISME